MAREIFAGRIRDFEKSAASLESRLSQIALLRFVVFAAGLTACILLGRMNGNYLLGAIPLSFIGFLFVVRWNERVLSQQEFFQLLAQLNQEEIDRLDGKLSEFEGGEQWQDVHHPFASDLDIFGEHSLFQLLNRSGTPFGHQRMAAWLLEPAAIPEARDRQQAIRELAGMIDWRQNFQGRARLFKSADTDAGAIREWLQQEVKIPWEGILKFAPMVLSPLFFINIGLSLFGLIPGYFVLGQLILHLGLNWIIGKTGDEVYSDSEKRSGLIKAIGVLIGEIEAKEWESNCLKGIREGLKTGEETASKAIRKFSLILTGLEYRLDGNAHFVFNNLFFWDVIWLYQMKAWKKRHKDHAADWFVRVGEFEALCGLAATTFARLEWTFPELESGDFHLEGEALGHPLITSHERVYNPVNLTGRGQILLITGSNMSGKSTYLRTVGINIVLALMGAPVCAKAMRLSEMQMVTSMRTLDSIEESTSSFYAELKRLKRVLEAVREGGNVLFLLDEILKGTNSRDRHTGAQALIRQLHAAGGSGMVSTHDLELAALADELPQAVLNYHFSCEVKNDNELIFDYTLKTGVCQSMNATQLMRGIGIDI